eukprot:701026-Pelagomonas_calceolata.AAC.1
MFCASNLGATGHVCACTAKFQKSRQNKHEASEQAWWLYDCQDQALPLGTEDMLARYICELPRSKASGDIECGWLLKSLLPPTCPSCSQLVHKGDLPLQQGLQLKYG